MPKLAALVPNATGVQPAFALFVGGTDILKDWSGQAYGTTIDSVEIVEAGPGGVSSIDFTIDDPGKLINIGVSDEILMWNYINAVPLFRGYVDHWDLTPDFGGQGRRVHVIGIGVEAWLDWLKFYPAWTILAFAESLTSALLKVITRAGSPLIALRHNAFGDGGHVNADLGPAGSGGTYGSATIIANDTALPAGATLRETIRTLTAAAQSNESPWLGMPCFIHVTVDWNFNVYAWHDGDPTVPRLDQPDDWPTLIVSDTPGGAIVAENLSYAVEPGDIAHEVYVNGASAVGSGLFGDGSGLRRRQDTIDEPTSTTAALAQQFGQAYLAGQAGSVRGSFSLSDWPPPSTAYHAGGLVTITDAAVGLATTHRIMEIRKTFNGSGRQNWIVSFGGTQPSAVRLLRRLTREVLS